MGITAGIVGALGGGLISAMGAQSAADTQASAANNANALQWKMYRQNVQRLAPYTAAGNVAMAGLMGNLPGLVKPIKMDQATLEQTPGYQFNLSQGLKAVQSSAAARGLGSSGAAIRDAAEYANGLAASTYQQQFNNAMANKQMAYNTLGGVAGMGENAAAGVGNAGMQTATNMGNNLMGAANGQAAATIAGANGINGSIGNIMNMYMMNNLANRYSGSGLSGSNSIY